MTNFERLHELNKDELAWFLMAYSDGCRCCVYKNEEGNNTAHHCLKGEVEDTCIGGYKKWLDREPSKDDEFMFSVSKHNVLVDRWNALSPAFQDGWQLKYENGLAVDIVECNDTDEPDLLRPF